MRKLDIGIRCGEKTCAEKPGVFCQYLRVRIDGFSPRCLLFDVRLDTSERDDMGWVLRCEECIDAEIKFDDFCDCT